MQTRQKITFARLSNSDLLYNNAFLPKLNKNPYKHQVYTAEKREEWKSVLQNEFRASQEAGQAQESKCSSCFEPFSVDTWLLESPLTSWLHSLFYDENRYLCYFCMHWHCGQCMLKGQGDCLSFEDAEVDVEDESSSDEEQDRGREEKFGKSARGTRGHALELESTE